MTLAVAVVRRVEGTLVYLTRAQFSVEVEIPLAQSNQGGQKTSWPFLISP